MKQRRQAVVRISQDIAACYHRCFSQLPKKQFMTYRVALFPSPSGTETKTCEHRPRPALEEQDREDHTERRAESAADEESAEAVVPLQDRISAVVLRSHAPVIALPVFLLFK
jgi:hypothetical protein